MPVAAEGLTVRPFAEDLDHPRWLHLLPNGDVLVAETNAPARSGEHGLKHFIMKKVQARAGAGMASPNRISLLRDADCDGVAEQLNVFLSGLNSPFGMAVIADVLYIANTDAVVRTPYRQGSLSAGQPVHVVDLPAGPINHHWTKDLIASDDGRALYATRTASPGSRARGPCGLRSTSATNSAVISFPTTSRRCSAGPSTAGRTRGLARSVRPDYAVGTHTGSLGFAFNDAQRGLRSLGEGAFVGQHGSWNRKPASGYRVIFIPFVDGWPVSAALKVLSILG